MSLRKGIIRLFCATLFVQTPSYATPQINPNLLPGFNSIQIPALKQDVTYLASPALQGRLSLTQGDNTATQWIAEQFKAFGLQPANGDSYLQAVPLIEYYPDRKHSYLELQRSNQRIRWVKPNVISDFKREITATASVVFAGYGITAPDLNYDDYQSIDVKDKFVLVFEHEPQETKTDSIFNGTANTIYATNRIKALTAQEHGAIGILIAPEPNRKHPSNEERYARLYKGTKEGNPFPSQALQDSPLHIPIAIITDKVANRIAGKQLSLAKLQSAIDKHLVPQSQALKDSQITLHDQNRSQKTGTSYNVVGLLEGSDPELKQETILITAHHDHDGTFNKKMWPGADDNASGTAGVLALAKSFAVNADAKTGTKPKRSLLFVVFAAEERGLLGSYYMAEHPLRPLATTRAVMNLDMIGRNEKASKQTDGVISIPADTTNRLNIIGAFYSPDYKHVLEQQNHFIGLTLDDRFDHDPVLNVLFRSDQFPFLLHHIPAFWLFTGFHPDYHQSTDTADKINYAKMQKILRLVYLTGYSFADQKTSPAFIANPGLSAS